MAGYTGAATGETVHVALGRGLTKGKMILDWVFKNLRGMEIVILHVHRPPKLIPMREFGPFLRLEKPYLLLFSLHAGCRCAWLLRLLGICLFK